MAIALSWSRLSDYQQCPRKFYLKFVAKAFKEEEKGIHLIRGEQMHKQLEDYVTAVLGQGEMPPGFTPPVQQAIPLVDKIISSYSKTYPEAQVACRRDWTPDEWYGKDVAWRCIWDLTALNPDHGFIGDYKSGKIYPYGESYGQLHLSAAVALNRFPNIEYVDVAYLYLEHKKSTKFRVTRHKLPEIQSHFDSWYNTVQEDKEFKPKVNEFCKWCAATKAQCEYSRKL